MTQESESIPLVATKKFRIFSWVILLLPYFLLIIFDVPQFVLTVLPCSVAGSIMMNVSLKKGGDSQDNKDLIRIFAATIAVIGIIAGLLGCLFIYGLLN